MREKKKKKEAIGKLEAKQIGKYHDLGCVDAWLDRETISIVIDNESWVNRVN